MHKKRDYIMDSRLKVGLISLLLLGWFFIVSAIFMATWNYAVPRLAESADSTYDKATRFRDINYPTSMVAVILTGLIFAGGSIVRTSYDASVYHHKGLSDKNA